MAGREGGARALSSGFRSRGVSLGYLFPCSLPGRLSLSQTKGDLDPLSRGCSRTLPPSQFQLLLPPLTVRPGVVTGLSPPALGSCTVPGGAPLPILQTPLQRVSL